MELTTLLLFVCVLAFVCEWVDASLGMGYGTMLSPLLIIAGFPVTIVVPAILISQACGGVTASYFHHQFQNAHFAINERGVSDDLRSVILIATLGTIASIGASIVSIKFFSKEALSTYVGILVLVMGTLMSIGFTFRHTKYAMVIVGVVSAFNKGLSGGGFGPLVTGGQIVLGNKHHKAVSVTTFAEGPICIAGFLTYAIVSGIANWSVVIAMTIGAVLAGPIGAYTTMRLHKRHLKNVITVLLIVLGSLTLLKTYGVGLPISM